MQDKSIGIIDSGIGGLSIWQEVISQLPYESTIYIGDSKHCPYGARSVGEIYQLSSRMVEFLLSKDVKLIIIACNTITVTVIDKLRKSYPKVPLIGIVPVIKTAAEKSKTGKIGVLSTTTTADSEYQKRLINTYTKDKVVINIGTDQLVPLIERGEVAGEEVEKIVDGVLAPFCNANVDVLALGCSHFPFLRTLFEKVLGGQVLLLDSSGAVVRQVKRILDNNLIVSSQVNAPSQHTFYTTGDLSQFSKVARKLLSGTMAESIEVKKFP